MLKEKYRKVEYVQCRVCFVNVESSLHENVVFSVCVRMGNATYIIFIMWNSISSLEAWYHLRFNISCGVAVTVRSHQTNSGNFWAERTHRGGRTHNVTQRTDTHKGGGRTHSVTKRTDTQGGTHPKCNPTNGHTYFFDKRMKLTN